MQLTRHYTTIVVARPLAPHPDYLDELSVDRIGPEDEDPSELMNFPTDDVFPDFLGDEHIRRKQDWNQNPKLQDMLN